MSRPSCAASALAYKGGLRNLVISGDTLLGLANGIVAVDISDPAAPTQSDLWAPTVAGFVVQNGMVYATAHDPQTYQDGISVISLSGGKFSALGSASASGQVSAIAVSGNYAYQVIPDALVTIDVTAPASPKYLGQIAVPSFSRLLVAQGQLFSWQGPDHPRCSHGPRRWASSRARLRLPHRLVFLSPKLR